MAKYYVNPEKCISIKGKAHKAGSLVEIDDSQVKRLLARKVISDPAKPLLPTPQQEKVAAFKAKPPVKVDGSREDGRADGALSDPDDAVKGLVG